MSSSVPDINRNRPFIKAKDYLEAGWYPIPVPEKSKFPPEVGYTGRNGAYADLDIVSEWIGRSDRQNVALRMGALA